MMKFKFGDHIVGNEKASARYALTTEGWEGVVIYAPSTTGYNYDFRAKEKDGDNVFSLHNDCFDLASASTQETAIFDKFYPKKHCENCNNFVLINKVPIYGVCQKNEWVFKLWQTDARKTICGNWQANEEYTKRKNHREMIEEIQSFQENPVDLDTVKGDIE